MEFRVKIGDKLYPNQPNYENSVRDGRIMDIRPDGFHIEGTREHQRHVVFRTNQSFNTLFGAFDVKRTDRKAREWRKWFWPSVGRYYPWHRHYRAARDSRKDRTRLSHDYKGSNWFLDIKDLFNAGLITQGQWDVMYDFDAYSSIIDLGIVDLFRLLKREGAQTRTGPPIKNMAISTGTYYVASSGQDYQTWAAACADVTTMTGDLNIVGHAAETIAESSSPLIDSATGGSYVLRCYAQSSAKHSSTSGGGLDGHIIDLPASGNFEVDEGTVERLIISDLAIDASGASRGFWLYDCASGGGEYVIVERCVVKGDGTPNDGIIAQQYCESGYIRNNIVYGFSGGNGIQTYGGITEHFVLNNTVCKNSVGIYVERTAGRTVKNNLCQGNTTDYSGNQATTAKNISQDATSWDASYQSMNKQADFTNYASDDYTLDNADTDLDDGDDLSAIGTPEQFSDDIDDTTRSTWFIGAFEFVSGGGAYTLTVDSGSYSLTGTAIDLLKGSRVSVAAGSYALTGSDIDLLKGYALDIASGSYALTGSDVSFPRTYNIGMGAGSYALTGSDISLLRGLLLSVESGSYVLTGSDASLLRGYSIAIGSGSYALTGADVALLNGYLLGIGAGSYVLTGADVGLIYSGEGGYSIVVDAGSYALTGSAVSLKHDRLLSIGGGTYAIIGTAVDLLQTHLLGIGGGSYALTGSDADLMRGYLLGIGAGSYIQTGSDVTLTYTPLGAYIIDIAGGSYALTGADIGLRYGRLLSVGSGAYSVTGTAIDLLRGYLISNEVGSYTLTGSDMDFLRGYLLGIDSGTYSIDGQDVTLTYSGIVLPSGLVSVTFTANRPSVNFATKKPKVILTAER